MIKGHASGRRQGGLEFCEGGRGGAMKARKGEGQAGESRVQPCVAAARSGPKRGAERPRPRACARVCTAARRTCTAAVPTPPLAPRTSSVWPRARRARSRSARSAVPYATGSAAASSRGRPSGWVQSGVVEGCVQH